MIKKKVYLLAFFVVLIVCTILLYTSFVKSDSKEVYDGTLVRNIDLVYKG